jgi:hypothetical protein
MTHNLRTYFGFTSSREPTRFIKNGRCFLRRALLYGWASEGAT